MRQSSSRSFLIFPAWGFILLGSAAFFYSAFTGMLGS
jgi:hypothetical protein